MKQVFYKQFLLLFLTAFFVSLISKGQADESRLLFSFENPFDLEPFKGAPKMIVSEHSTNGKHSLKVELSTVNPYFAIIAMDKPFDFNGWEKLKLDIYREGEPITLN
ncbi:MAG: hypothetical protein ACPL7E_06950, partial [bacterium]